MNGLKSQIYKPIDSFVHVVQCSDAVIAAYRPLKILAFLPFNKGLCLQHLQRVLHALRGSLHVLIRGSATPPCKPHHNNLLSLLARGEPSPSTTSNRPQDITFPSNTTIHFDFPNAPSPIPNNESVDGSNDKSTDNVDPPLPGLPPGCSTQTWAVRLPQQY